VSSSEYYLDFMNNQTNEVQLNTGSPKKLWIIVGVAVGLTALIVGGGVYAWQRAEMQKSQHALQRQIETLQQVQDAAPTPTETARPTPPTLSAQPNNRYQSNLLNYLFDIPEDWTIADVTTDNSSPQSSEIITARPSPALKLSQDNYLAVFVVPTVVEGRDPGLGYTEQSQETRSYNGVDWVITTLTGTNSQEFGNYAGKSWLIARTTHGTLSYAVDAHYTAEGKRVVEEALEAVLSTFTFDVAPDLLED